LGAGNENEVTITIFKLVVNGNDLTVTSGGNDAHLWFKPSIWLPPFLKPISYSVEFSISIFSKKYDHTQLFRRPLFRR
jgi:hypothetical protein